MHSNIWNIFNGSHNSEEKKKISNYPYSRFDPLMRKWEGMKAELNGFFIKRSQSSAMQITHANHDRLVLNSKHHIRA